MAKRNQLTSLPFKGLTAAEWSQTRLGHTV